MRSPASNSDPLLYAEGVVPRAGSRALSAPLSFAVRPGEIWALTGPSGAGKSTLLKTLTGALPSPGVRRASAWAEIPQGLALNDELTAAENVAVAQYKSLPTWRALLPLPSAFQSKAIGTLAELGLSAPHQRTGLLSGGEKQRVALSRSLLEDWRLLLADEPISQLDAANARRALSLLRDSMRARNGALLLVLHHEALAAEFATHRLHLADGSFTFS